jgi:hypothetical protein
VPVSLRRTAAIQAGAVPALCGILQAGAMHSVPIALDDVLKASTALVMTGLVLCMSLCWSQSNEVAATPEPDRPLAEIRYVV